MGGEGKRDADARAGADRVQDPGRTGGSGDGEARQDARPVTGAAGSREPDTANSRPADGASAAGPGAGSGEGSRSASGSGDARRPEATKAAKATKGNSEETPDETSSETSSETSDKIPDEAPQASAASAPESASEPASESSEGAEGEAAPAAPADAAPEAGTAQDDARDTARQAPARGAGDGPGKRLSRRFPALTRDTARPEGGGRAVGGDAPAPVRQWPMLTVTGGVAIGLLLVAVDAFRAGALVIGLSLLAGAALRRALPVVGMLAVRSRFTDMVIYGVLGVLIILLALMAQPHPWLQIPFLDDIVHFTVR